MLNTKDRVAYFSLEIGLTSDMKTYAGGLGILAGDTLKSCADMGLPVCGISLLYHHGYFKQKLQETTGVQLAENDDWDPAKFMTLEDKTFEIVLESRKVKVQIWRYDQTGVGGHVVPVYFLDTNLPENHFEDQAACFNLYSKYPNTRLKQEILLGVGGVIAMKTLGFDISKYHLNESHAAFAVLALEDMLGSRENVIPKIVFTTHTPVEHGHKKYSPETIKNQLEDKLFAKLQGRDLADNTFNMTRFCLENAAYSNGVAKKHGEVSRKCSQDLKLIISPMVSTPKAGLPGLLRRCLINIYQAGTKIKIS